MGVETVSQDVPAVCLKCGIPGLSHNETIMLGVGVLCCFA